MQNKTFLKISLVVGIISIFLFIGLLAWWLNKANVNKTETTHASDVEKTTKDFVDLNSLIKTVKEENPSGENWSIKYETKTPLEDRFVISIDSKNDKQIYEKAAKEIADYFKKFGFDPCKEPLSPTLAVNVTNSPKESPTSGMCS